MSFKGAAWTLVQVIKPLLGMIHATAVTPSAGSSFDCVFGAPSRDL
jgi:hypothetical protein